MFLLSKSGYKHTVHMVSSRNKNFFLVKCMNLMYIINFKVFGYSHPFRRKMQTKVNLLKENMVAMLFFMPCFFWPLCFVCSRIFHFVFDFWSQNMLIAAPMQSRDFLGVELCNFTFKLLPKNQYKGWKCGSTQNIEAQKHGRWNLPCFFWLTSECTHFIT
jgi:hypothetical protein